LLAAAAPACSDASRETGEEAPSRPARPTCTITLTSGGDLGAALIALPPSAEVVCLAPGRWLGPLVINRKLHLWGPPDAVLALPGDGAITGSVVTLAAPGITLAGLTIDGRGGRFDKLDAAVHVIADDATVEGVTVVHAVYGILVEKTRRAHILGNHVIGDAATAMGMRGDTIRLWESDDATVAHNLVEDGRDIVVWYSRRNLVAHNRVLRGRYGTHLMYSHDNQIRDNAYVDGVVGVFVMYSRNVTLTRNLVLNASGASGMAIGLKDSGALVVTDNLLLHDTTGLYIDDSPNQATDTLLIARNAIRQCTTGVHFHTTPRRTTLSDNDFVDNASPVAADAGTRSDAALWHQNHFDDYAGYDLDDDGTGDLPHRVASASDDLVAQLPALAFFQGTPALSLVDLGARLLPLWKPRVLLVDDAPRMSPHPLPALTTVARSNGVHTAPGALAPRGHDDAGMNPEVLHAP
ncbi:MAG: nitrous oxide reductase family maturation protein NosD, partial [Deltaproteobacteria bacterium]|nr:nitrous oxide reductase family maturation protein NosD [Deltaproteobacteria bacterium]